MSDSRGQNQKPDAIREKRLSDLYQDLERKHMAPYWVVDTTLEHDEDSQVMDKRKAIPYHWSYSQDIEPLLHLSAELISLETSERRSIVLVNPGLAPSRATLTTLYMAYRQNDPVEIMPPHRHSPNAIRLGLTGNQNFTGVEGEDIVFGPRDMVLTPHDTWHNHGNEGLEPAINLSVLDLPLAEALNSIHFEHDYEEQAGESRVSRQMQSARFPQKYSEMVYGLGGLRPNFVSHNRGTGRASPMYVYRWDAVEASLAQYQDWDGDPYEGIQIEYVDPLHGGPIYRTMTFKVQLLRPGERTQPVRQTASVLYAPLEGSGHSLVDGEKFQWTPFDTLAVPGGYWCQHVNESETERAVVFIASDEPTLTALGFYRKFARLKTEEVVRIDGVGR